MEPKTISALSTVAKFQIRFTDKVGLTLRIPFPTKRKREKRTEKLQEIRKQLYNVL